MRRRAFSEPSPDELRAAQNLVVHREKAIVSAREVLAESYERLLDPAARMLGLHKGELQSSFSGPPFVSREKEIHGELESSERGVQIVVSEPLLVLLTKMAGVFATRLDFIDLPGWPEQESAFSPSETGRLARDLLESFWKGTLAQLFTPVPELNGLTYDQLTFGGLLSLLGYRFVLAHEFGHIVLDRCNRTDLRMLRESLADYALPVISLLPNERDFSVAALDSDDLAKRWAAELAADLVGQKLMWESAEDGWRHRWSGYAIDYVLVTYRMLEEFRSVAQTGLGQMRRRSHPPSEMRRLVVRDARRRSDIPPDELAVGEDFEMVATEIMDHVSVRGLLDSLPEV